jgi:hypothetical protein
MGARAQYVVIENGAWQRYYSHWGANRVAADLLAGPAAATRCFRANRDLDEWLDDVWCEGAALVDLDRRVLLWYCFLDSWAEHVAVRRVLARTWPGWDIRFAHDGVGDLTDHLGLGRDAARPDGWFETCEPSWYGDVADVEPWSVVSLRLPDGRVAAWNSGADVIDHLACGSGLVELLPRAELTPHPIVMPYGGVHFEPEDRSVSVWSVGSVAGVRAWPLPGWEGWTLDFRGDDHSGQEAVLPADFPFPHGRSAAALASALGRLRERLGDAPPDVQALIGHALSAPGPEGATAAVNPAALVPHSIPEPAPGELALLHHALTELIAEAEAHADGP